MPLTKEFIMPRIPEKVELLAPAGNFEKLEIAVHYGADAVYLGDKNFSLRNFADNFTLPRLQAAAAFTRQHDVKLYVACNIYSPTYEADALADYLRALGDIGPDGVIVADPGVFLLVREIIPHVPVHLSTQANTTSLNAVRFWEKLGVRRINIARELSLAEIRAITGHCTAEIEAFVHGAMCVSYSGRCLLSHYLSGRDSNRGMCSHPCRWRYHVVEQQRPGQYLPVAADDRGTYIFSSRDLCMIEHLDRIIESGVHALKIEGRMKSINYLAATVKVYREAIDAYYAASETWHVKNQWLAELAAINNRGYSTGFYFGSPADGGISSTNTGAPDSRLFAARVVEDSTGDMVRIQVRNKIFQGDGVEILTPGSPVKRDVIAAILDETGTPLDFAQPNSVVNLRLSTPCRANDIIRKIIP